MAVVQSSFDDDYSNTFHKLRAGLRDIDGIQYTGFLKTLKPDYRAAKLDIALGYAMLGASCAVSIALTYFGVPVWFVVIFGGCLIGYWIAYLQLFLHEAAHFNLADSKVSNDKLANIGIGWMVGTSIEAYRPFHFEHHRSLGTARDSEFSYFYPLNTAFLLKLILGTRAVEVVLSRWRFSRKSAANTGESMSGVLDRASPRRRGGNRDEGRSAGPKFLLVGLAVHAAVISFLFLLGGLGAAAAWVVGVGIVYPFLNAVRQLLEHRRPDADPGVDYRKVDHGPYTRMFGRDLFSSTFGGAGFNRHLLHHWEPQVAYTRLPELENFLLRTDMRPVIEARRTGYFATFLRLLSL